MTPARSFITGSPAINHGRPAPVCRSRGASSGPTGPPTVASVTSERWGPKGAARQSGAKARRRRWYSRRTQQRLDGGRVSIAFRDALFGKGLDRSDPTVLEWLARDLGVVMLDVTDHAAVPEDGYDGRRRGVHGSPHFYCGDNVEACMLLDLSGHPGQGILVARDAFRPKEFLERCFAGPGSNSIVT